MTKTTDELKPYLVGVTFTRNTGQTTETALRHGKIYALNEDEALGVMIRTEEPEGDGWNLECKSVFEEPRTSQITVEELERVIAQAALCILSPNSGITDTIWMPDKVTTLFDHLAGYIDMEFTGVVNEDIAALQAVIDRIEGV